MTHGFCMILHCILTHGSQFCSQLAAPRATDSTPQLLAEFQSLSSSCALESQASSSMATACMRSAPRKKAIERPFQGHSRGH